MTRLLALALLASPCHADGLAAMLMPADPCGLFAPAIVEVDSVAQADLWAMHCGRIPTVAQMVAYVPGHKTMFWRQPEPLPASVWMTLAGVAILGGRKWT